MSKRNARPFARASSEYALRTVISSAWKSNTTCSSDRRPASIFDRSRMSEMVPASASPQAGPEHGAVAPRHLHFALEHGGARQQGAGAAADVRVGLVAFPHDAPRLPGDAADRPAEHLLEARVRMLEDAIAGEGDADH